MAFPTLNELEVQVKTGSAVTVVVEGESIGDDAWIYGDIWFGGRATEIRFLPQDGWLKVRDAVAELRARLPGAPIFGLIDRDFTPDHEMSDLESEGVYRSVLYSVENYLLDPDCWLRVFQLVMRRHTGAPPQGWRTREDIESKVAASYASLIPCAAFNCVIAETVRANPGYRDAPTYIRHVEDARLQDAEARLREWGSSNSSPDDLGRAYLSRIESIRTGTDRQATMIDGKLVLKNFLLQFRQSARIRAYEDLDYVNHYLDKCPEPPQDAVTLVARILAHPLAQRT